MKDQNDTKATTDQDQEEELLALEARLQAANERRAQVLDSASASAVLASKRLAVEVAEQAAQNATVIEKWTREKGPRGVSWDCLEFRTGIAIFGPPPRKVFEDWSPNASSTDASHLLELVSPCVKYPSMVDFDKMLGVEPMKLIACSAICARLGGAKAKDVEGK